MPFRHCHLLVLDAEFFLLFMYDTHSSNFVNGRSESNPPIIGPFLAAPLVLGLDTGERRCDPADATAADTVPPACAVWACAGTSATCTRWRIVLTVAECTACDLSVAVVKFASLIFTYGVIGGSVCFIRVGLVFFGGVASRPGEV